MIGLSTSGSISLGCALVAGRKRVPRPAAGKTALRTLAIIVIQFYPARYGIIFPMTRPGGLLLFALLCRGAEFPAAVEGDYTVRNFRFHTGDVLPELRLHYYTIGKPS